MAPVPEAPERCGVSVALAALPVIEVDGSREFVTVFVGVFARGGVVLTTGGVEGVDCKVGAVVGVVDDVVGVVVGTLVVGVVLVVVGVVWVVSLSRVVGVVLVLTGGEVAGVVSRVVVGGVGATGVVCVVLVLGLVVVGGKAGGPGGLEVVCWLGGGRLPPTPPGVVVVVTGLSGNRGLSPPCLFTKASSSSTAKPL